MKVSNRMRGRCFCGGIQFYLTPPTRMLSHCHCESCRRSHGAPFVSWTSVHTSQFSVTAGEDLISEYESSPGILWKFCKHCGSPLFQTTFHTPAITYIAAASLIDPLDRQAEGHFCFEEKVPWLEIGDRLPTFRAKTSDIILTQDPQAPE